LAWPTSQQARLTGQEQYPLFAVLALHSCTAPCHETLGMTHQSTGTPDWPGAVPTFCCSCAPILYCTISRNNWHDPPVNGHARLARSRPRKDLLSAALHLCGVLLSCEALSSSSTCACMCVCVCVCAYIHNIHIWYRSFTISLWPHLQKINLIFDFSSWGSLGINFWVRGHFGRALSGISFWVRKPPGECCLCTATDVSYGWSCGWGFKSPAKRFTLARLDLISIFTLKTTINN
jgi:hypothetical protein